MTAPARSSKKFDVKVKTEEGIAWRGQIESWRGKGEKRNCLLFGAPETSRELAEWRRLQRKNLNTLGLPKRKSGLSATT